MLEFEKKIILNRAEYTFLKDLFKPSAMVTQINYYYDTDSFDMNKNGITCRIREKDSTYKTVIKDHQKEWQDCSIENIYCESSVYDDSFFKSMGLCCQGILSTNRIIFFSNSVIIMLDKNSYLGTIDYELEIEYEPCFEKQAEQTINFIAESLVSNNYIQSANEFCMKKNTASKSSRFFNIKAIQQNNQEE